MKRTAALEFLARTLRETITEGEVPLHYIAGTESNHQGGTRADKIQLEEIELALRVLGYDDAADVCRKEIDS